MARGVDPNEMARERARRAVLEVRAHRAVRVPAWLLPLAIALVVAIEAAVLARQTPPAPRPFDAPNTTFSAERARRVLERFLGDGAPRPTGSAANARARERIIEELRSLGQQANVESGMVCGQWGVCAQVNNVVARIPGREQGRAVLLAAHYDSVPAAPGAADDGSGVATMLEIARVLKVAPPRRPVLLLFDDGEELGLLGAELFVRESPHFADVDTVVNLEARGTSGPSLMFETSPGNAQLIAAFAGAVTRPATSSALYEVYRRLPNDSDFSVFRARGLRGYNFAFIGGMAHYHTTRDELSRLSLASLQHHGDNALSSLRALSENPSVTVSSQDAVFFDMLGWRVIWWKRSLLPWFCGGAAFLLSLALAVGLFRGAIHGRAFLASLLLVPVALALCTVVAFGLELLLHALGGLPAPWVAHPEATFAACLLLAVAATNALAAATGPEGAPALWGAVWTWFCCGAVAAFATLPGASFLLLIPTMLAGICGLPWLVLRRGSAFWSALAALAPILATCVLWLPKLSLLYPAVGFFSLPAFTLAFAVPALTLAPLFAAPAGSLRRALLLASAILVPVAAAAALWIPRTSRDAPQRLSLAFHQDADTKTARYLADVGWGPLPAALQHAGLNFLPADPRPWAGVGRAVAAPAPMLEIAAPELAITHSETASNGRRTLRGRLRSPRGAPMVRLHLAGAAEVRVRGVRARSFHEPPYHTHTFVITDQSGLEIEIAIEGGPVSGLLVDQSFDLPPAAQRLAGLRSDTAVPFHFGDATIVSRGVRL